MTKEKRDKIFRRLEVWCCITELLALVFAANAVSERIAGVSYHISTFIALGLVLLSAALFIAAVYLGCRKVKK